MKSNIILEYQYRPISITETVQCLTRIAFQRGSLAKTVRLILISHKHHIKINQPGIFASTRIRICCIFDRPHVSGFVAFLTVHTYACLAKAPVCLSTSLPEHQFARAPVCQSVSLPQRQFPQSASFARVPACQSAMQSASFPSLPERQFYQSASLPVRQFYKSASVLKFTKRT